MLTLQDISYRLPNEELLFTDVSFTVNRLNKIALIGNNGAGKSTLFKIIAKELTPSSGQLKIDSEPYHVPQIFGQYNRLSVAQALRIEHKLHALQEIINGNTTEELLATLNDDWTIETRCHEALSYWHIHNLDLNQKMETLSGGQKTKVFLAGISIHDSELVLLDEPSNHLDIAARKILYDFIQSTKRTMIVVSHDRKLLNQLNTVFELSSRGIKSYGGNYDFYAQQKEIELNALNQQIENREKTLTKAREKERKTLERQHKLDSRGKKKQEKSGVARIMMNTLRNQAERSTSKIKDVHEEKIGSISQDLHELRSALPDLEKMKFGFDNSSLHHGKRLFNATNINFTYDSQKLWAEPLSLQILSGERIRLSGSNGSGKTTLIRLLLGELALQSGSVYRVESKSIYIDQDYSLIRNEMNVFEQAQQFNTTQLLEHEIKIRLNRFLFTKEEWDKPCSALSGGERMRLILCCLTIASKSPDIIILDEPTNNLDIQSIQILTAAINEYEGTLIVVSHDETFLEEVNIQRTIELKK